MAIILILFLGNFNLLSNSTVIKYREICFDVRKNKFKEKLFFCHSGNIQNYKYGVKNISCIDCKSYFVRSFYYQDLFLKQDSGFQYKFWKGEGFFNNDKCVKIIVSHGNFKSLVKNRKVKSKLIFVLFRDEKCSDTMFVFESRKRIKFIAK